MTTQAQAQQEMSLSAVLGLRAAAPLAQSLMMARGADIVLNGSEVQQLGAQCLQVLMAAAKTWRGDGRTLEIVHPSADFLDALRRFGLDLDSLSTGEASR